ncbi:iron-sulfur cluster repair di-iron protein, ric [Ornithinibacillus halophilus]|uniref:Regulator of cell morphogenesis and NO signaling n=1 Tax=Ornithinibacillus halophilus TaxID=930117 RepID=A0A1M5HEK7_9BACI|nr:iron-sulfur cluster repair di-iron protein, ric [Ornithinibacillus halophilus]SHG14393.1 regulator of cell morphogenesis and NO signaling [Ornithinibacillus halophilus]
MSQQTFNELVIKHFEKLDLYTTAITRAHGKSHPEAFEVRELFETINEKVKESGDNKPDLITEFVQLRKITENYTIPEDVCETYASTFNMLGEVDKAYHA